MEFDEAVEKIFMKKPVLSVDELTQELCFGAATKGFVLPKNEIPLNGGSVRWRRCDKPSERRPQSVCRWRRSGDQQRYQQRVVADDNFFFFWQLSKNPRKSRGTRRRSKSSRTRTKTNPKKSAQAETKTSCSSHGGVGVYKRFVGFMKFVVVLVRRIDSITVRHKCSFVVVCIDKLMHVIIVVVDVFHLTALSGV